MPIPQKHRAKLRKQLHGHELMVKLGKNPKILAALNELHDDAKLRKEVKANPTTFVKKKGISLPRGAQVSLREFSTKTAAQVKVSFRVEVRIKVNGGFRVGYDSDKGFYAGKD